MFLNGVKESNLIAFFFKRGIIKSKVYRYVPDPGILPLGYRGAASR